MMSAAIIRTGLCLFLALASAGMIRIGPSDALQAIVDGAPADAVLVLESGVHQGPLVVRERMTIRGEPGAHLRGSGKGIVLTIEADDVHVENLTISGSGRNLSNDDAGVLVLGHDASLTSLHLYDNLHGIYVRRARNVQLRDNTVIGLAATEEQPIVENDAVAHPGDDVHHNPPGAQSLMGNGIHLWSARDALVTGNHIHHVRDGIYVAHTRDSTFAHNRIHDSRYGIHYMYSSENVIAGNELWNNVAGPALMFSRNLEVHDNIMRDHAGFRAYGLLLQDIQSSSIHDNEIRGNRAGIRLQQSSANTFERNRIYGNLSGMTINSSSRDNAFTRNDIGLNLHQVELTGPAPSTQWSVDGVGNRWHGSIPMDLTGDGISEWPHHEVDLMSERREAFAYVQLLVGSPGIRAIEWALKRAPVPGMRHVTDPHPLTRERRDD